MAEMMTVTARIPQALGRALAARAKRQNRPQSALVREAIEALVSDNGKTRPGTVGEVASRLFGCVSGVRDLSTNPRYMEGFGK
jgi:hypothetical protein